jgi:ribonuclease Z
MRPIFHPELVNGVYGDPALYVDLMFEKRGLLFDLGDVRALAPRKLLRISDVFVSHTHMDHFMGFDWFLRVNLGRARTVRLFGPPRFLDQLIGRLGAYTWNLVENYDEDLTIQATELQPDGAARTLTLRCRNAFRPEGERLHAIADGVLLREPMLHVRCTFLDHKIPVLAFALEESAHVNVWRNRVLEMGLPLGPWLRELKHAVMRSETDAAPFPVCWRDDAGEHRRVFSLGELKARILRTVPGQKLAYVTDTAYHPANATRIVDLARGADLLFIESVYLDADREIAAERYHLTAPQAGTLAREAGVKNLVPFHFSPRYHACEEQVRDEVARAFGRPIQTWPQSLP